MLVRDTVRFALALLLLSPWWDSRSILLTARYNAPVLLAVAQQQREEQEQEGTKPCADPLAAILSTLDCVQRKDAACATAGYNSEAFVKLHNGVDTNTSIDAAGVFWSVAFELVTIRLDYDHAINVPNATNAASIRYVETVNFTTGVEFGGGSPLPPCEEYPFGQSYSQREHAIVTVDDDCKMVKWDQYGDNREQAVVDETAAAILSDPAVRCHYAGVLFFPEDEDNCQNRTITCRDAARHNDDDEDEQKAAEAATSQDHCGVSMT